VNVQQNQLRNHPQANLPTTTPHPDHPTN